MEIKANDNYMDFAHRRPQDYSPKQKRWAILIAVFLLSSGSAMLYIFLSGKSRSLIYIFSPLTLALWGLLIKVGNRIE